MQWLIGALVQLLGALSVMVAIAAALVGGLLLLLALFGGSGGFILNDIGILEPLVVLGAGNLVCFVLNVGILTLRRWHDDIDWLRNLVVRLQLVPAVLFVAGSLLYLGISWRHSVVDARSRSIETGLAEGSAAAVAAFEQCTGRCQRTLEADQQLLLAAQYARLDWANLAIRRGGRVGDLGYTPYQRTTPVTCENGVTIAYANALELAVIHDDPALIDLILQRAEQLPAERALYTAAILGRQATTKHLLGAFGLTALPPGLERLARQSDKDTPLTLPAAPLQCQLPSWDALGFPRSGIQLAADPG